MKEKETNHEIISIPKTISQSIYNYLKKSIIENKLKVNERINEKEIADIFRVSRTPVREAVARLAAEGFINIDYHREAVVKEISFKEIQQIFEVIRILDSSTIDLVVDNIDIAALNKIEKMTSKLESYFLMKDINKYIDTNIAIHEKMWAYVPNDFLQELLFHCSIKIKRYTFILNQALANSENLSRSMSTHQEILKALKNKEKEKLKILISKHWVPPLP